jgi:apolipoprotein N-acyltransferase
LAAGTCDRHHDRITNLPLTDAPAPPGPPSTGSPSPRRRRGRVALTGLAIGVLLALSVPPAGFWPLAPIGIGLLGWRLADRALPTRALTGFSAGVGLYGITLFWMGNFNAFGAFLIMILEASFLCLAAVATPPGRWRYVVWPAAIIVSNAARTVWPFGGLPMGGIDLSQAASPLAPVARLGGPLLVAGVIAVAGMAGETMVRLIRSDSARSVHPTRRFLASVAVVGAVVTVGLPLLGRHSPDGRIVGQLRVAAVQGGGRRGLRAVDNPPINVLDAQLAANARVSTPVDLVLWPENVIALDTPLAGSEAAQQVGAEARRLRTTLIAGITEPDGSTHFFNAAVAWDATGTIIARYDKVHRVPFGEYVPGRGFIAHFVDLDVIPRDAVPGHGPGLMLTPAGPVGVVISFEVYFSGRARDAINAGGQVLLVPTNTASYTTAQVPSSEIATARLRAWETGRDVVMAAPTGFSAILDPRGRLRMVTGLGRRQVLTATVDRRQGSTPYLRLGDRPFVIASLLLVLLGWVLSRARPGRDHPIAEPTDGQPGPDDQPPRD